MRTSLMPVAQTHRFSVADYLRMAEAGIVASGVKVELIEGEIVDMLPIGPFHSGSVSRLARAFNLNAKGRWLVWVQSPLQLGSDSMPEPDLALLRPSKDDYTTRHPCAEDVFLVIEIADSSLSFDQTVKLPLYARAGIEEVWILNAPQRQLEVYTEPGFTGYGSRAILRDGTSAPRKFPDADLDVAALFK